MYRTIREFFAAREVLEVETPLISAHTVCDPHLSPFTTRYEPAGGRDGPACFLQTSPESAMKRLLAAGSGSIFQICKAFRNGERGRWHNPEFTLLEWYRTGFDLDALTAEVEALLAALLDRPELARNSRHLTYRAAFERFIGIDPLDAPLETFRDAARALGQPEASALCGEDRGSWLDYLFGLVIQPGLASDGLVFIRDFPACLTSLARNNPTDPRVVERVEVFIDGVELGNGYHELSDPAEQRRRFDADLYTLAARGAPARSADLRLLAALQSGLPDCCGIALGLDRLLMLRSGAAEIAEVLAFDFARA